MRDAALIKRVRERKLNEIFLYTSTARIEPEKMDCCMDIVSALAEDVGVCGLLLETDECIDYEPYFDQIYYDRLSAQDRADEDAFIAQFGPSSEDEDLKDYIKALIEDAVSSMKGDSEPMDTVKEELRICRERIETLSSQLDYSKSEAASFEERLREAEQEKNTLAAKIDSLKSENASVKMDLNLAKQKISVLEPAYEELNRKCQEPEQPAVEEPKEEEPDEGHEYVSDENVRTICRVREMKDSKIDQIIEEVSDGKLDMEIGDDIIDFLKTDIAICDAILSIDFKDHKSVVDGFRKIVEAAQESNEPKNQDYYVSHLTPEEASLEFSFSQVINSMQGMMMYMKDEIY